MRLVYCCAVALLLSCLAGCGQPSAPAVEGQIKAESVLKPLTLRAQADEAAKKDEEGEGFRFPEDKGGQLLARTLPPDDRGLAGHENVARAPKRLAEAAALEHPAVPLPPNQGQVPRLSVDRKGPPLRPRSLRDDLPFSASHPAPPQEPQLPAGDRVRLPGPDPNQPVALPVLPAPVPDRTTGEDPTAEFSSTAAQSAVVPSRGAPAPPVKISLPDPFENHNTVRLRETPPEKDEPVTATPRPPGK